MSPDTVELRMIHQISQCTAVRVGLREAGVRRGKRASGTKGLSGLEAGRRAPTMERHIHFAYRRRAAHTLLSPTCE